MPMGMPPVGMMPPGMPPMGFQAPPPNAVPVAGGLTSDQLRDKGVSLRARDFFCPCLESVVYLARDCIIIIIIVFCRVSMLLALSLNSYLLSLFLSFQLENGSS